MFRLIYCSVVIAILGLGNIAWGTTYSDEVLADNPLAYWQLNETGGTVVADSAAGGLHGGTATAGVVFGKPSLLGTGAGSAIQVSGNERVTVPGFEKFDAGATGYTVEYWLKLDTIPTAYSNLVGDREAGSDFYFMNYITSSKLIRPHYGPTMSPVSIDSAIPIVPGKSYHIATTWDQVSGTANVYINGTIQGTTTVTGTLANTNNTVFIGKDNAEPGTPFTIDEVAYYDYALSSERINAHIAAGGLPASVVLSTEVLGPGTYYDGYTNGSTVEIVRQIPNVNDYLAPYTSDPVGPTIDVSPWIVAGGTAGGLGSDAHGRGGNLWISGDGDANVPHVGFGGHANWIVTFDVDEIRTTNLSGTTEDLHLSGRFGTWGSVGGGTGVQGAVFLDGVRIDSISETVPGGPSSPFDLSVPAGGKYLTLAILSGPGDTAWDDGNFIDVVLAVGDPYVPPGPFPNPGQIPGLPAGLISYWDFDEAAGPVDGYTLDYAYDRQDGNHGSFLGNATRVSGLVGLGAAHFNNASGAGIDVGAGAGNNFAVTDGITVEALIDSDWDGASDNYDEIFRKEDGDNRILFSFQNDSHNGGANPPVDAGPVLSFGLNVGGAYNELDMPLDGVDGRPTLAEITDGTHHVAATYDSATGEKAIWVDGQKVWTASYTPGSLVASGGGTSAYIGNSFGLGEPFSGVIDEVAVWNRALTTEELASHYASISAGLNYFTPVPEPGSLLLLLSAALAIGLFRPWRKKR